MKLPGVLAITAISMISAAPYLDGRPAVVPDMFTVYAVVEDAAGQAALGLGREDFELLQDGVITPINDVTCAAGPLTMIVLIDVTASALEAGLHIGPGAMIEATERLFSGVVDGDRVRVGAIAARLFLAPSFAGNRREMIAAARKQIRPDDKERRGPSPVWDAVDAAVQELETESGRRAIILLSDGRVSGNRLGLAEVANRAMAAAVSINVVSPFATTVIQQTPTLAARVRPQIALIQLASVTGGVFIDRVPKAEGHPERLLTTVLPRMRHACAVTFAPLHADGLLHRVELSVKRPGLQVLARRGFVARLREFR